MNQSYLPAGYCWAGKSVQVATVLRDTVIVPFCAARACRGVVAFSGWRRTDTVAHSDHLCGFAVDFVPKAGATVTGYAQLRAAQAYAKLKRYPYVEFVWTATNRHCHVSFRRCP